MRAVAALAACSTILIVLVDAFCTIILARRTERILRFARRFYSWTWSPYSAIGRRIESGRRCEDFLSVYGPASLLLLFLVWAAAIVASFGVLHWAAGLTIRGHQTPIATALYYSGATFFTIQMPDAQNTGSKIINVIEGGMGFSFLGLAISYIPTLYTNYSSRELRMFLLDVEAGSPPSAASFLVRHGRHADLLQTRLTQWSRWIAELAQHQHAYPMLSYFRSPHENQSWLTSLVAIMDASAIAMLCAEGELKIQSRSTFAVGRHAIIDLARIFPVRPQAQTDRLPSPEFIRLQECLARSHVAFDANRLAGEDLSRARDGYEREAAALSKYFLMALPSWLPDQTARDNWQTSLEEPEADRQAVSEPFT